MVFGHPKVQEHNLPQELQVPHLPEFTLGHWPQRQVHGQVTEPTGACLGARAGAAAGVCSNRARPGDQ